MAGPFYPRCRVLVRALLETFDGGVGDDVHTWDVIPRSVTIERNTLREADSFTAELDWRDFPIDPRAIRSVLIAIHLGERLDGDPSKRLGLTRSSRAFIGYVDEPRTRLSGDGEIVEFKGRDYTGIFLDYTWPSKEPIDVTRPLELVLGGVLQAVPGAGDLVFEFSTLAQSARFARISERIGRTKWTPKGDKDDAWTVISDLVGTLGLLPVVELDRLVIKAPSEFGDQQPAFIYGRNLSSLEMVRKFNEVRSSQIRVTSWDAQAGVRREATWPESPVIIRKRIAAKSGKVTQEAAPLETFAVSGGYGVSDLTAIAQRIYEDGAREQFEGTLKTKDLSDIGGLFKLPRLGNGDSLTVELGNDARASIAGLPINEGAQVLTEGPDRIDPRVALAIATALKRSDRLQSKFYVKTARHRWDRVDGYELDATFINFVGSGHS